MSENFQNKLLKKVDQLFQPLLMAAESGEARDRLFGSLGWDLAAVADFPFGDLQNCLNELATAHNQVETWLRLPPTTLDQLLLALGTVRRLMLVVQKLHQILDKPGLTKPAGFEKLAEDLIEFLTVDYLADKYPSAAALAMLATIITRADGSPSELVTDPATRFVIRHPTPRPKLHLDRIPKLFQDPVALLKAEYMPNGLASYSDALAAAHRLFPRLTTLFELCGIRAIYGLNPAYGISLGQGGDEVARLSMWFMVPLEPDPAFADRNFGAILSLSPADRGDLGLVVSPFGRAVFTQTFERWLVNLRLEGGQDGFAVHPRHGLRLPDPAQEAHVSFDVTLTKLANETGAAFLVGGTEGTRLEIGQFAIKAAANLSANQQACGFLVEVGSAVFVVSPRDGDGFLQKVFPKGGFSTDFDLAIGWSNRKGVYIRGSAGLEATLAINKDVLGVLNINSVYLALRPKEAAIETVAAATATVKLGPVTAVIERMGLEATLTFPREGGNLGPANLALGFKSPDGAGLTIDSGIVVGGGYLFFDKQNQQYAGAVQLEVAELLNLSAFGLITTRMPDGYPGYSLLVLISARFTPPVQLGYGFTLNGVGGLVGVNRTAAVDALRLGLRAGALGSILFPVDPLRNAPQIVSDLAAIFPPAENRFLFGPMAILGWGTPTLLTLELGLVLELPAPVRLFILGRLRVLLPEERFPVVRLQLDALGVIDFTSGDVALDAVLYDSVLAQYVVTGEMALRANFGANPGFVLAVGGFHPGFPAPAGFPALDRVAISLATGDNPRLRLEAYLAVTTNTVQFGAHLELYAELGAFSLEGLLGFDALIHFDPFGIAAELGAVVALKADGRVLQAIMVEMTLTGPTPWHAQVRAKSQLLGIPASFEFEVKFGEEAQPPLPAPVQLRPLLLQALKEPGNWSTQLPKGEHPIVTLREQPTGAAAATLVHPLADLQVSQRVAPLDIEITRFGNTTPEGERKFELGVVGADGDVRTVSKGGVEPITDFFAPAQFFEMSDDEKLAAPAFEQLESGIRFSVPGFECGKPITEDDIDYEESIILVDPASASSQTLTSELAAISAKPAAPYKMTTVFLERVAAAGAAGRTPMSHTGRARYRTAPGDGTPTRAFRLEPPRYAVIDVRAVEAERFATGTPKALAARSDDVMPPAGRFVSGALSYAAAMETLRQRLMENPKERGRLRVAPHLAGV